MEFKNLELKDKDIFEGYFFKNKIDHSAYNFTNMYIYKDIIKYKYAIYNSCLLIYSELENIFYLPLKADGVLIDFIEFIKISEILKSKFKEFSYLLIPEIFINANLKKIEQFFKIKEDENYFDYVYLANNLANLSGKKFHSKRNLISQFERLYPAYRFDIINKSDFDACFKLAELWCDYKNCEDIGFTHETYALKVALSNFKDLNFNGIKLVHEGNIIAFSIFTPLNKKAVIINFEKYNPEFKGSSQVINKITAIYLKDKFEYINREQDLGIEGLRKAKKSYNPDIINKVYSLS